MSTHLPYTKYYTHHFFIPQISVGNWFWTNNFCKLIVIWFFFIKNKTQVSYDKYVVWEFNGDLSHTYTNLKLTVFTEIINELFLFQVQACIREAERIEYLVQTDSPLLKAYTTLTPFLLAPMRAPSTLPVSGVTTPSPSLTLLSVLVFVTFLTKRTLNSSWYKVHYG